MATEEPDTTTPIRVPLGEALEKARIRVGFSVQAAASAVGVSETELAHYECGIRTPSADISAALARIYGVEPERLGHREFVARVPGRFNAEEGALWLGWCRINFDPLTDTNEHLLRSIGAALRSMRSLPETAPVFIRSQEIELFASLIDLTDENLAFLVMRYLRLSYSDTTSLIAEMWRQSMSAINFAAVQAQIAQHTPPRRHCYA